MPYVSGMLYEYYHICRRKLWYVAHGVSLEEESENVQLGKLIDASAYARERKHVVIDEHANIDFLHDQTVYEIKKSSALKEASLAQIKYYLYVLKQKGVEAEGELRVPAEKLTERVRLTEEDTAEIEANIAAVLAVMESPQAPPGCDSKKVCASCAFYELCFL